MTYHLKNKIVLITGASSGIGEACATQFAQAGASLILCARRDDILNKLTQTLKDKYGTDSYVCQLDVRHRDDVTKAIQSIPHAFRHIDILVNNAGLAAGRDTLQESLVDDWDVMIDTNVKGLLYVTHAVLPGMIERNAGHIINLGSIAGHQVYPKGAVYCATKHAVNALTLGLRLDLSGTNIRVTTVDPGAVKTNFSLVRFKGDNKLADAVYEDRHPLTADDVADAILFCASRPAHVNISEMIIMPTDQASATVIAKQTSPAK